MQLLPHTTTQGKHGPVHTIELGHKCAIQVLPSPHFDKLVSRCPDHHRGRHYEIAACTENGKSVILMKNAKPPSKEQIDRDDAWHRRLELASILPGMLDGKVELNPAEIKHLLPLSLLIPSYKAAFSPDATPEEVLKISFVNTQQRFEKVVASYLAGELKHDVWVYSQQGVIHLDYNHIPHSHPIVEDFAKPFDPAEFAKARKAPKIGKVQNEETFQQQGHQPRQVRQFLIKMPGTDVKLPREFAQFEEAVQIIIDHNKAVNLEYDHSYAYLNVFRGLTLFSSYRGLSLNCHGDQLQSLRTEYAFKPDFSYIVSNTLPTLLYDQPFDLTEALERFRAGENINLYDYMNGQADERYLYRSENFGIYLLSPYIVHSAAAADRDVYRVFMKVAFSTKRFFDNRELRRNPAFDNEDWYQSDTVGYVGGWLSHAHWNERFLKDDVCPA